MALIGKIREKSWLLVTLVGVALLAFILSDYKSIMGVGSDEYGIGTVYGKKVDVQKYDLAVQRATEQTYRMQVQQTGNPNYQLTQQEQENASEQGWNTIVQEELLSKEFEELGIDVSETEFKAYIYGTDGFTPLPEIAQSFTDSATGVFKKKELEARIKEMSTSKNADVKKQWEEFRTGSILNRKRQKYIDLLSQGVFVTSLEAEDEYYAQKETKSVSVVFKKYSDMNDADFKVSDAELNEYYEKHKNDKKYEILESTREVKTMEIVVVPSKQDTIDIRKKMDAFKSGLQNSKNDSIYIYKNSDVKLFSSSKQATAVPMNHPKANRFLSYPMDLDTIFKSSNIGDVVGPYFSNGNILVSKVQGFTPSKLKARHVLINLDPKADSTATNKQKNLADSLLKLITKDNFEEFVKKHSGDQGSKEKGGVIDDFLEGEMVKEFGEFCATQPIGTIGLVKSQFGFHIIEVLERDDSKLPVLASVAKTFKSSQETIDTKENESYSLLETFESKLNAISDLYQRSSMFDTLARQKKYGARNFEIKENSPTLRGQLPSFVQDKVLKFAFDSEAKAGTLLSAPIKDKDKYFIVYLSSIKKKGIPNLEDVKGKMREEIIQDKKFARISNQISVDKTLEDMARRVGVEIIKADVTFKNPQITNVGMEPEVIGYIFSGVKDGQRTKPIKGKAGVFVVRIDSTKKAPATTTFKVEKDQLLATLKGSVQNQVIESLSKKADVIDNRNFNRLGIIRE
jgi:peptidyl-prolyl cis-trans isomerase D